MPSASGLLSVRPVSASERVPLAARAVVLAIVPLDQVKKPPLVPCSKSLSEIRFALVTVGAANASLSRFAPPPLKRTNTFFCAASGAHGTETVLFVPQPPVGASGTVATGALLRLSRWMLRLIAFGPPLA